MKLWDKIINLIKKSLGIEVSDLNPQQNQTNDAPAPRINFPQIHYPAKTKEPVKEPEIKEVDKTNLDNIPQRSATPERVVIDIPKRKTWGEQVAGPKDELNKSVREQMAEQKSSDTSGKNKDSAKTSDKKDDEKSSETSTPVQVKKPPSFIERYAKSDTKTPSDELIKKIKADEETRQEQDNQRLSLGQRIELQKTAQNNNDKEPVLKNAKDRIIENAKQSRGHGFRPDPNAPKKGFTPGM